MYANSIMTYPNENSLEDLLLFVKQESFVDDELTLDTGLEEDLGIYGDDAIAFMLKYSDKYNVDIAQFMAADYFSSESRSILLTILSSFFCKESMLKKSLTIRHLYEGIKRGRLDEDTIMSSNIP